jgi:hypothetical protein
MKKDIACIAAIGSLIDVTMLSAILVFSQEAREKPRASSQIINNAGSYHMQWRRHFQIQTGLVPAGAADDIGNLWLITHAGPGKPHPFVTKINPNGLVADKLDPVLPLTAAQRIASLTLGVSGNKLGLLASVVSGGREQNLEGAYFVPIVEGAFGRPIFIKQFGAEYPVLIGVEECQFLAASDQSPIALVKLDVSGNEIWRRALSRQLALPTVSLGSAGSSFVLSQGKNFLSLQKIEASGRTSKTQRISSRSGFVVADRDGGCSVLFSPGYDGKTNEVSLATFDENLHQMIRVRTPLIGWGGRTYQIIVSMRGHVIIGEGPTPNPQKVAPTNIIAEMDKEGKLLWQQNIESIVPPLLVPFQSGFYLVRERFEGEGFDVEKYAF